VAAIGYDRLAAVYDLLTRIAFAGQLQKAQRYLLTLVPPNGRVLALGGGTGWWLPFLYRQNPGAHITFVEPSEQMLRLAKKYASGNGRVDFVEGTQHEIPPATYDAMVLFCVLDLFNDTDLMLLIRQLKNHDHGKTLWLINDFQQTKWWHRYPLSWMYQFFRLTTGLKNKSLPDWKSVLSECRLAEQTSRSFLGDFISSGMYAHA